MAKLLKDRARKPIMESAVAVGSQTTVDQNMGYRIDLYPADRKEHRYEVLLTREEMLGVVASWLHAEARYVAEEVKRTARALG